MTFAEAVAGTTAPDEILASLQLLEISYRDGTGTRHTGQIVVHEAVGEAIRRAFDLMERIDFPLARVVPINRYGWSDDASMADNNTSAFNYRLVAGTSRLSAHARGLAIDINPLWNPVIYVDGRRSPPGAFYLPGNRGVLEESSPLVRFFLQQGWVWGGQFDTFKDYHHFEKRLPTGE